MSREGGAAGGGGREGTSGMAAQPFPPQFYPVVGYQGPPHAWLPPHPATGVPAPWSPSWRPPMGYPAPTPPWPAQHDPSTTIANTSSGSGASDEYTVDTLRRVFKDDDGRVEIQRVKVQRRHPESGAVTVTGPEAMSVVPVGTFSLNERRPPPRKNRRKQEIHVTTVGPTGPYPWYPYMPYMPYPYPYPYYFPGCVWPPGAPSDTLSSWSGNDESEGVSSHQDSALNSQRLESRVSHLSRDSLPLHRSSSPAAASHITDTHSIAPSDSVSVRGRKRETSLERALLGPTPPPRTKSRASSSLGCKSDDADKTQEWMLEMQRALRSSGDGAVKASGKGPLRNDPDGVYKKIPPVRKRRKKADDMSDVSSMTDLKDIDDLSERQSAISDVAFDDSRLSPELNYAFRKLERSVEAFKHEVSGDSPNQSNVESPSLEIFQSSGEATPTEAHGMPFSDIRSIAEKSREEEAKLQEKNKRQRAVSESVSSPQSIEASRAESAPDVSIHPMFPVVSPEPRGSATTTSVTLTSPPSTSTAQVNPSVKERDGESNSLPASESTGVLPKAEVVSEPPKPPSSEDSSEASNTTLVCRPPSVPQSQGQSTATEAKTPETGSKAPTETVSPSSRPAGILKERSAEVTVDAAQGEGVSDASGRHSRASSATTFFSTRTADDSHVLDTDSTDIPMPTTDSATADENEESPESTGPEDDHPWVLQRPGEAPTLNTAGQDERRNAWRAEVSLWRARLVVSLCRGRGLDRQDWATFHLMVHHPLTLDLKLSLLHAPRLCAANSSVGPAVLRVALIQLAQYGETLLQPDTARQPGWRSIRLDSGNAWVPVKGSAEILQSLGYQERSGGTELKYSRRCSPEASVVARLTLDMLVLAEEFRLFLTGTHQYPSNVSDLFYPESLAMSAVKDLPPRPPSSEGSFISAQSEAPAARVESRASSVTDEDTETLETCALAANHNEVLLKKQSTTEEEVNLREDDAETLRKKEVVAEKQKEEATSEAAARKDSETLHDGPDGQQLLTPATDSISLNSEVNSLPDLQSGTTSGDSQRLNGSEVSSGNETITPGGSPTPTPEVKSNSEVGKTNHVAKPTANPAATNDNPEEHVYEEIDVIRAQVQNIRASSVPTDSAPPPLPPKKKVSSGGEDDSGLSLTYPQVEWSSASMPGSLRGGSTGARRKKRRAPMPPEFMPEDWKQTQDLKKEDLEPEVKMKEGTEPNSKKKEYRRSLNPFYEEIDAVQDEVRELESEKTTNKGDSTVNGNPFYETKAKATGYIGKNPFYDDVEILKKSDEFKEMKRDQPSPATSKLESTSATPTPFDQQDEPPVVRPKRRAPRPPPTPPGPIVDSPQSPASPQNTPASQGKSATAIEVQVKERESEGDRVAGTGAGSSKHIQSDEITVKSSEPSDSSNLKDSATQDEVKAKGTQDKTEVTSLPPLPPPKQKVEGTDTPPTLTPKMNRAVMRVSPSHPRSPPPPPPTQAKSQAQHKDSTKTLTEETSAPTLPKSTANVHPEERPKTPKGETPPPIPAPKAPLSLLDEIPYMDASELRETKQPTPEPDLVTPGSATATPKLPRQPPLVLASVYLPPAVPPPPPPCPPPDSPPETPHTSPPETPHVSPPETPHTSPPVTPHASPTVTPRPSPKPSPLPLSRHQTQHSLDTAGSANGVAAEKDEIKAPPVPPKATQQEGTPPLPPKTIHPEPTSELQNISTTTHDPVTGTPSMQSSASEERYEIPDTSRAPPPRPPVPTPPVTQQTNGKTAPPAEYDRYEVPEDPKQPVLIASKDTGAKDKAQEAEERYEIPQVVKETPVKRGVNGGPMSVSLGHIASPRRGEISAIFGPPKPPRRRRNNTSPPPRPPKHPSLADVTAPRPSSVTSSFTSSSSGLPPAPKPASKPAKHRSWPFLLCDCLYVNCRNYEDVEK